MKLELTEQQKYNVAYDMAMKALLYKETKGEYGNNKSKCPYYRELKGYEQLLSTLDVQFSFEFDNEYDINAVIVDSVRVRTFDV